MTNTVSNATEAPLVQWTYGRQEWRSYQRWRCRRKGILHYLFHHITLLGSTRVPQVTITQQSVLQRNVHEVFVDSRRKLRHVNIRDEGNMNVLEIGYQERRGKNPRQNYISVLVPRGKLREAVALQLALDPQK